MKNEIKPETIVNHMKSKHGLEIEKIEKMSHPDARAQSFKVTVKSRDKDLATSREIWPHCVKVRLFRHKRHNGGRDSNTPTQFRS